MLKQRRFFKTQQVLYQASVAAQMQPPQVGLQGPAYAGPQPGIRAPPPRFHAGPQPDIGTGSMCPLLQMSL